MKKDTTRMPWQVRVILVTSAALVALFFLWPILMLVCLALFLAVKLFEMLFAWFEARKSPEKKADIWQLRIARYVEHCREAGREPDLREELSRMRADRPDDAPWIDILIGRLGLGTVELGVHR